MKSSEGSAFRPWKVAPTPFNRTGGPFTVDVVEVTNHGTVWVGFLNARIELSAQGFTRAYVPAPDSIN